MLKKDIGRFLSIVFLSGLLKGKKDEFQPPPLPFPKLNLGDLEKEKKKIPSKKPKPEPDEAPEKGLQELEIEPEGIEFPEIEEKPDEIVESEEEIQRAVKSIQNKEKKSIFKGLFKAKEKKPKFKTMKKDFPLEFTPKTYEKHDKVEDILNMVHKARKTLMEFDLDKAKSIYIEMMRIYNSLSEDERGKVYKEINDIYYERKNAESLNIR